jgi:hypothetical protein
VYFSSIFARGHVPAEESLQEDTTLMLYNYYMLLTSVYETSAIPRHAVCVLVPAAVVSSLQQSHLPADDIELSALHKELLSQLILFPGNVSSKNTLLVFATAASSHVVAS